MSTESKMCKGSSRDVNCPLKESCYRYTRQPDKNQEYYRNIPYQENGDRCDFYLPKWVLEEIHRKTKK